MLDIIILILVGRHVASIARRKDRSPVGYVLLMILAWYAGALCGALVSLVSVDALGIPAGPDALFIVATAVAGAGSGIGLTYLVVCSVRPLARLRRAFDEYEDYDDVPADDPDDTAEEFDSWWSRLDDPDNERLRRRRRDEY